MSGGISVGISSATPRSSVPGLHARAHEDSTSRAAKVREGKGDFVKLPTREEAEEATYSSDPSEGAIGGRELSAKDKAVVEALKNRDREIRAHEGAHLAAAGQYAMGGAKFTYRLGPDNRLYAVHGEVRIDPSPIPGDPQATLQKAEVVRRAALAPANPSAADKAAAARADRMARAAREQIGKQQELESKEQRGEIDPLEAALAESAGPRPSDGTSLLPSPGEAEGAQAAGAPQMAAPTIGGIGPMSGMDGASFDPGLASHNATEALETYAVIDSAAFSSGSCGSCKESSCLCSRGYA